MMWYDACPTSSDYVKQPEIHCRLEGTVFFCTLSRKFRDGNGNGDWNIDVVAPSNADGCESIGFGHGGVGSFKLHSNTLEGRKGEGGRR